MRSRRRCRLAIRSTARDSCCATARSRRCAPSDGGGPRRDPPVLSRPVARVEEKPVLHRVAAVRHHRRPHGRLQRPGAGAHPHRAAPAVRRSPTDCHRLLLAITPTIAEVAFAVDDPLPGARPLDRAARAARRLRRPAGVRALPGEHVCRQPRDARGVPRLRLRDPIEDRPPASSSCSCRCTMSAEGVRSAEERDRAATAASLRPAAAASGGRGDRRVARSRHSIGRRVFDALRAGGFTGPDLSGQSRRRPTSTASPCVPIAARASAGVDLAVIAVPAPIGARRRRRLRRGRRRSRSSSSRAGFAEAGEAGRALQRALVERVRESRHADGRPQLHGRAERRPGDVRLNASFSPVMPPAGACRCSSQSGALGIAILELAARAAGRPVDLRQRRQQGRRLGQRPAASTGSATRRRASSCSISSRSATRGGSPGWRAASAARKPIVAREGRAHDAPASRAAGSHTAALAASDVAVDALFQQSGVIRADTIDEMFDIAACLDAQPLPAGAPRRRSSPTPAARASSRSTRAWPPDWHVVELLRRRRARGCTAFLPSRGERRQPGRHDRVGRSGRVSPARSKWC